jgi:hypothetical protein
MQVVMENPFSNQSAPSSGDGDGLMRVTVLRLM